MPTDFAITVTDNGIKLGCLQLILIMSRDGLWSQVEIQNVWICFEAGNPVNELSIARDNPVSMVFYA